MGETYGQGVKRMGVTGGGVGVRDGSPSCGHERQGTRTAQNGERAVDTKEEEGSPVLIL